MICSPTSLPNTALCQFTDGDNNMRTVWLWTVRLGLIVVLGIGLYVLKDIFFYGAAVETRRNLLLSSAASVGAIALLYSTWHRSERVRTIAGLIGTPIVVLLAATLAWGFFLSQMMM
jgi:uncharacterized membrane protein YkgB